MTTFLRPTLAEQRLDGLVLIWRSRSVADQRRTWHGVSLMPVSNDTLLRVVRRYGRPSPPAPNVIGIDDWAWKRKPTLWGDYLRPRAPSPGQAPSRPGAGNRPGVLAEQPQIAIVARDRGGGFALAASRALPHALQVADRWHLMENASAAFLSAVRKSMRRYARRSGAALIKPGAAHRRGAASIRGLSPPRRDQRCHSRPRRARRDHQGDRTGDRA